MQAALEETGKIQSGPLRRLGWRFLEGNADEVAKVVMQDTEHRIVELRSGERRYCLSFPVLSPGEESLVAEVLESFQANEESKALHEIKNRENLWVFFEKHCEQKGIELEADQFEYLFRGLEEMAFGLWPLTHLLSNDSIEEIAVIGIGVDKPVRVFDSNFGWLCTNVYFSSPVFFRNLVNKMSRKIGRRLSFQTPRINAVLENGSRLHCALEPVSFSGPCLTIRKFKQQPLTPLDLIGLKTLDANIAAFLAMTLQTDCSILICGNTGSGKTSTLNALFCFVPATERVIAIEETPELNLPHRHQVRLATSPEAGVSMKSLIVDSLRMRPDRIVVGEIRTKSEVKAFVDTLLAGQGKGSYATFHAQSSSEALTRMKTLGVLEMDLASLDLIIVQKRLTRIDPDSGKGKEERRIVEISEVRYALNGIELVCLFEFDFSSNEWVIRNESRRVQKKIMQAFGFDEAGFGEELERRMQWLSSNWPKKMPLQALFERLNGENAWKNWPD